MVSKKTYKLGILSTHPIQYFVPWYRELSAHKDIDLTVFFCHKQTSEGQAKAGYGVSFEWDIPMLEGYNYQFLDNISKNADVFTFFGCDTPNIKQLISKGDFDAFIVEGWFNKSFWQAIFACWKSKTPIMVRGDSNLISHGGSFLKRMIKHPIYNWFIPKFNSYLVVGKYAKEYYLHYGANEKHMFFTPHSVDNDFFTLNRETLLGERNDLRRRWDIPDDAVVFVLVGRLIPRKLPQDFIAAVEMASKANPKIWGLIVGDGTLKKGLQEKSEKNNIQVKFTGFMNQGELPKAYAISDCLVNTSLSESWGLTINEAMASKLPILVSDTTGCMPDLLSAGETGYQFKCGDIKDLSEKMLTMASSKEKMSIMGKNSL